MFAIFNIYSRNNQQCSASACLLYHCVEDQTIQIRNEVLIQLSPSVDPISSVLCTVQALIMYVSIFCKYSFENDCF